MTKVVLYPRGGPKQKTTPRNLKNTSWMGGENPGLAGNMMTTPEDYDSILRRGDRKKTVLAAEDGSHDWQAWSVGEPS